MSVVRFLCKSRNGVLRNFGQKEQRLPTGRFSVENVLRACERASRSLSRSAEREFSSRKIAKRNDKATDGRGSGIVE